MKKKYIRWLGAFRHKGEYSLNQSMLFELSRACSDEVAVEIIEDRSYIFAKVGLLVGSEFIKIEFSGDCWSEYGNNGRLMRTANPRRSSSKHKEAFAAPKYQGIVVKGKDMPKKITKTLRWVSAEYNLPIYRLTGNSLKEISL